MVFNPNNPYKYRVAISYFSKYFSYRLNIHVCKKKKKIYQISRREYFFFFLLFIKYAVIIEHEIKQGKYFPSVNPFVSIQPKGC